MSNETYTVLIVDDSNIISKRMEKQLLELDCITSIFIAYSFNDAVIIFEDEEIDVVILDINLTIPGKNGLELLQFVKDNYPYIKTIMLTKQSGDFYKNLCEKIGSDYFVDKSVDFDKVPSMIRNFYNNRIKPI